MRIIIACDHAGFELKEHLKDVISAWGYEVVDRGAPTYERQDDYPDYVTPAARAVSEDDSRQTRAIIIGSSGQGEAIVANRFAHVRAVVYAGEPRGAQTNTPTMLMLTREHNDANVLSLGARFLDIQTAEVAVKTWLETPFSNEERHIRRIQKIETATSNVT
ncbi:TPA: ribose-5-phosphate isomerase [Patescibacteria group bacterium]|nr:MAG: Ribose-5-phosphate isomerase B [Parcubacteria group bacterium GW2011_GWD2_42_14]HCC05219.1 ribose-5-phosphate isomerase [Patescibacteria group bacterium]